MKDTVAKVETWSSKLSTIKQNIHPVTWSNFVDVAIT